MGGHAAGDRASTVAVKTLMRYVLNFMPWFFGLDSEHEDDLFDELKSAVVKCQEEIHAAAVAEPERAGMGTTLTMAYVLWPRTYVVHVGDSRCYLLRKNELEQITRDHTVAQKLVEEGRLQPEQVESSRYSSVLWNALGGGSEEVSPEVYKVRLKSKDTILLCTDGLTKHVKDTKLLDYLSGQEGTEGICQRLVDAANDAGGTDNITTVIARFGA
jgi:protein phosphatase